MDPSNQTVDAAQREFDIVVFGATGFTGKLVAEYLAKRGTLRPERWAIAGRNREKLEAVRSSLEALDPALSAVSIIIARSDEPETLLAMAARTRVVLTLVGPYAIHGAPLVAACVEAKTDYCDLTGEPAWWHEMIDTYHEAARKAGVLLISCCGFDSIPYDLGVHFTAKHFPADANLEISGYMASRAEFSGGTWASAVHAMANLRAQRRAGKRKTASGGSGPNAGGPRTKPRGLHFAREVGRWAVPLPTIDPLVVKRSARLIANGGAPRIRYHHYLQLKSLGQGASLGLGIAGTMLMAQTPWTRELLRRMRPSGAGPSPETRARSWFKVDLFASDGRHRVVTQVRGGDPGYEETAKMISESALSLAFDRARLPGQGGFSTPAAALGDVLLERLVAQGISFELIESDLPASEGASA